MKTVLLALVRRGIVARDLDSVNSLMTAGVSRALPEENLGCEPF